MNLPYLTPDEMEAYPELKAAHERIAELTAENKRQRNTVIYKEKTLLGYEDEIISLIAENKRLTAALGQCSRARAELLETLRGMTE